MDRLIAVSDLCLPHMLDTEQLVSLVFTHLIFTSEGLWLTSGKDRSGALQEVRQIMVGVLVLVKWLMISIRQSIRLAQEIWFNGIPHPFHKTFSHECVCVQLFCTALEIVQGWSGLHPSLILNVQVVRNVSLTIHSLYGDGCQEWKSTYLGYY